jgi:hypothetical protein
LVVSSKPPKPPAIHWWPSLECHWRRVLGEFSEDRLQFLQRHHSASGQLQIPFLYVPIVLRGLAPAHWDLYWHTHCSFQFHPQLNCFVEIIQSSSRTFSWRSSVSIPCPTQVFYPSFC